MNYFKLLLSLVKYRISLAVTFTSVCSFLFFSGKIDIRLIFVVISVFVLAGGASALNQYMERAFDASMSRTKARPIPSGKISANYALIISLLLISFGLAGLYGFFSTKCMFLGIFNVVWYNLFYTYLKKITPFAVIPGSMVGAVPVLIGWTAAGGHIFDFNIIFVAFFLFIWQIPHFYLILLKYSSEYEQAGFPSIKKKINPEILRMITYTWIIATSVISLMFPLFHIIKLPSQGVAILFLNLWFVIIFTRSILKNNPELDYRSLFFSMNLYMLLFMLVLGFYKILTF